MNRLASVAAVLVLLTGLGLAGLLALVGRDDLLFFSCAEPRPVTIEKVEVRREHVSDPVHALSSIEADITLTIRLGGQSGLARESITASEKNVQRRLDELSSRTGYEHPMLLCERFPTRFALERVFPWKVVTGISLVVVVLILPSAGALAHRLRTR